MYTPSTTLEAPSSTTMPRRGPPSRRESLRGMSYAEGSAALSPAAAVPAPGAETAQTAPVPDAKTTAAPETQTTAAPETNPSPYADIVATSESKEQALRDAQPGYGDTVNGYGYGDGQYVCTTYVQAVLAEAGYDVDGATGSMINIATLSADEIARLPELVAAGDERIKGVVTALVQSGQGLEIPLDSARPGAMLEPGDLVQYWYNGGASGHCVIVHEVVDDQRVVLHGSHSSTRGVDDLTVNLSNKDAVFAVRPAGSSAFDALVQHRVSLGLPVGEFADRAAGNPADPATAPGPAAPTTPGNATETQTDDPSVDTPTPPTAETSPEASAPATSAPDAPQTVGDPDAEAQLVAQLIADGTTGLYPLADAVFYRRHPELVGKGATAGGQAAIDEYMAICDDIVRPALAANSRSTEEIAADLDASSPAGERRAAAALAVVEELQSNGVTYGQGHHDFEMTGLVDCSEAVQLFLEAAGQGDLFTRAKAQTGSMREVVAELGGTWRKSNPLPGDLMMWDNQKGGGHVAMIVEVASDGRSFRMAQMGNSGANVYRVDLHELEADCARLGAGTFIGWWTPPAPDVPAELTPAPDNETATPESPESASPKTESPESASPKTDTPGGGTDPSTPERTTDPHELAARAVLERGDLAEQIARATHALAGDLQFWDIAEQARYDEGAAALRIPAYYAALTAFADAARLEGHYTLPIFLGVLSMIDVEAGNAAAGTTPTPEEASAPADIQLEVPFYSQFEAGHGYTPGDKACFKAAVAMAESAGSSPNAGIIQVGKAEDSKGRLTQIDPAMAEAAITYINTELEAGRPVVVGVSHFDANYNVDKLTDHFVTIDGRETVEGRTGFTYIDPGTSNETRAHNAFYADAENKLVKEGTDATGYVYQRRFEVSMVLTNAENPTIPGAN